MQYFHVWKCPKIGRESLDSIKERTKWRKKKKSSFEFGKGKGEILYQALNIWVKRNNYYLTRETELFQYHIILNSIWKNTQTIYNS